MVIQTILSIYPLKIENTLSNIKHVKNKRHSCNDLGIESTNI